MIAGAIGAITGFLVDTAGLIVLGLLKTDEPAGPDTVFGASASDVASYVLLGAGGIALLVASLVWRRRPSRPVYELDEEGEAERVE